MADRVVYEVRSGWVVAEFGLGVMWSGYTWVIVVGFVIQGCTKCDVVGVWRAELGAMQSGYGWFSLVVLDIAGYFLSKSAEIKDD